MPSKGNSIWNLDIDYFNTYVYFFNTPTLYTYKIMTSISWLQRFNIPKLNGNSKKLGGVYLIPI